MGPKRKKSKPNPLEAVEQPPSWNDTSEATQPPTNERTTKPAPVDTSTPTTDTTLKASPAPSRASWYGGSWRSKASPVAQIAKESISVSKGATSESSESPATRPPISVSKSVRNGSRKSIPLAAEATRVHATSDASDKSRARFPSEEKLKGIDPPSEAKKDVMKVVVEEAQLPPEPSVAGATEEVKIAQADAQQGWFGWWSRPDGYGGDGEKSKKQMLNAEEASTTPLPGTPAVEADEFFGQSTVQSEHVAATTDPPKPDEMLQPENDTNQTSSRSWFGLWTSAQNQQTTVAEQANKAQPSAPEITISAEPPNVEEATKATDTSTTDAKEAEERPQSSGWAFWSSDKPKDAAPTPGGTQKQIGELAVADTPSQSHPEVAQFNEQGGQPQERTEPQRAGSLLRPKRGRPERAKGSSGESSAVPTPTDQSPAVSQVNTPSATPPREDSEAPKKSRPSQLRPNLILPSFHDTFPAAPNLGYVERLTNYLASSLHLPGYEPLTLPQHIFVSSTPPKIKMAVALGIHGFFPAPLIQKVLGQPTGTSIRFANYAATSIKAWCQEHQPEIKDVEVEKVALEGEGCIADRVATLWKLLLNWLGQLRQADFILVACHSQGVPVAIMLVAKLIQLGALSPSVRLGVCAMAGISLGPFLEYKSRLFGGSALELFEFCDSHSKVSKAYAESMEVCLRHGVRVTFVGSLDDQLVSLESSLYTPLSHPYVARAVFIDGRIHAPNFLTHLVVFALKLRNLGISDHGLIRELSAPLAGSLVGGDGHSRVYDDPLSYKLAVHFALESTDVQPPLSQSASVSAAQTQAAAARRGSLTGVPASTRDARRPSLGPTLGISSGVAPSITPYETPVSSSSANPFYLPWAVRGMLEEPRVKAESREEVEQLVREFEEWRPSSKVLKDVRWRLEGVRSMVS